MARVCAGRGGCAIRRRSKTASAAGELAGEIATSRRAGEVAQAAERRPDLMLRPVAAALADLNCCTWCDGGRVRGWAMRR
jgi:hypothetical protein